MISEFHLKHYFQLPVKLTNLDTAQLPVKNLSFLDVSSDDLY